MLAHFTNWIVTDLIVKHFYIKSERSMVTGTTVSRCLNYKTTNNQYKSQIDDLAAHITCTNLYGFKLTEIKNVWDEESTLYAEIKQDKVIRYECNW